MAKNTEHSLKDPEIWIEIWHSKKPRQFRAWRYYGIIDALRMDVEIKLRAVLK